LRREELRAYLLARQAARRAEFGAGLWVRRLEFLEAPDGFFVETRQLRLDAELAVVFFALREVWALEGGRAADSGQEVEDQSHVLHLLSRDERHERAPAARLL
jgi:hypothetical protein